MVIHDAYYTYIVECHDGSLYTGITCDLEKRLLQHNGVKKGGAKYTSSRQPVTLKYFEKYATHKEAAQKEYRIKQLTREAKLTLIKT